MWTIGHTIRLAPAQRSLPGARPTRKVRADMSNATPPTPVGVLDDARNRAANQRLELAFLATQLAHLIDARAELHNDIADAVTEAGLSHLDWADVADPWHLADVDRGTDHLAAMHLLIERALGI